MTNVYKVKHIDFRRKGKSLKNHYGFTTFKDKIIQIHKHLPPITVWNKQMVLYHEQAHICLYDTDGDMELYVEDQELYCDLEAIARANNKWLSYAERWIKKSIVRKPWKTHRASVIRKIFKTMGIRNKSLIVRMIKWRGVSHGKSNQSSQSKQVTL